MRRWEAIIKQLHTWEAQRSPTGFPRLWTVPSAASRAQGRSHAAAMVPVRCLTLCHDRWGQFRSSDVMLSPSAPHCWTCAL